MDRKPIPLPPVTVTRPVVPPPVTVTRLVVLPGLPPVTVTRPVLPPVAVPPPPTVVPTFPVGTAVTITSPRVPSPRVPSPRVPSPRVPSPRVQSPRTPPRSPQRVVVPTAPQPVRIVPGRVQATPVVGGNFPPTRPVVPPPVVVGKNMKVPPPPLGVGKKVTVPPPPVVGKTVAVPPPVPVPPPPITVAIRPLPGYDRIEAEIRAIMAKQTFEPYTPTWKTDYLGNGYRGYVTPNSVRDILLAYTEMVGYGEQHRGYVMGAIMNTPEAGITHYIDNIGFAGLRDTPDVYYNLMWYINAAPKPYAAIKNQLYLGYLAQLTPAHIQSILGPRYQGPTDKASLLFAAISGKSSDRPDLKIIARYPTVAAYPPYIVWQLAMDAGIVIKDDVTGLHHVSSYPPHVHVALQIASPAEAIVAELTPANADQMIQRYGVALPTAGYVITPAEKVGWFLKNLKDYPDTFIRPAGLPPPPSLKNMSREQIAEALRFYTNQEIVDAYEPTQVWVDRPRLINIISDGAVATNPKWSWRARHCNNDDTLNVIYGDLHGDVNKDDPEDPTLSYGVQGNYRCYQASELAASFREDENGIFHFTVPDWLNDDTLRLMGRTAIDPTTGEPLVREFSVASIKELNRLLQTVPAKYAKSPEIANLRTSITTGLNALAGANAAMRRLQATYMAMTPQQQYVVRVYLAWLFLFAMWMRFWKGPPSPYPVRWVEGGGYGGDQLCGTERRDEHVILQLSLRTAIIEAYEKDPALKPFISDLPLVKYNFGTGEVAMAEPAPGKPYRINDVVEPLQEGQFCEAHGSDLVLQSAYYLIVRILGFTTGQQFNAFLTEMYPFLKDLEKQVVNYKLEHVQDRTRVRERVSMLEARQTQLRHDAPLPIFDPAGITRTGHTDPELGWHIQFVAD